jgi:hypothetical protein
MKVLSHTFFMTILLGAPQWALACAVCGSQEEKAAGAYLTMTMFLSLLPLSFMGSVGFILWRLSANRKPVD